MNTNGHERTRTDTNGHERTRMEEIVKAQCKGVVSYAKPVLFIFFSKARALNHACRNAP